MEAAKCPICEGRHFGAEHIWPKEGKKSNGETPLDQPVIQVVPKKTGVDILERRPSAAVKAKPGVLGACPVCEARKAKDRERVMRWRAKRGKP